MLQRRCRARETADENQHNIFEMKFREPMLGSLLTILT